MDFASSDPENTTTGTKTDEEAEVAQVLAVLSELIDSRLNVQPIITSNEELSGSSGCADACIRNYAPMGTSTTSSNAEPVKHDDMTNSSASSGKQPRSKLSQAERAAAAQKRAELKEFRASVVLQKQLEREQNKRETNLRKAVVQAQREAKKAKAATNPKPRRSAPKKTLTDNFASTSTSNVIGENIAAEDEVPEVLGLLERGVNPIKFAQSHPCGEIHTFGPWNAHNLQTYYHYIDSIVMNLKCQQLIWDLMLKYRVPSKDPSLHPIGSLTCCAGKAQCPVIFRAKYCFSMRAKLLHLFLYPYMKKFGYLLDSLTDHMWNTLSDQCKETFYRDHSKIGMYHEYIDMMCRYPPTIQEEAVFQKCYPRGQRVSPRPGPTQVLISLDSYQYYK